MDKRSLTINALSNGGALLVTLAVTFFVQPFLVHRLGDERFGVWLLIGSIIAYMGLGDFGIGAAVLRYVSRFDGLQEKDGINRVFSTSIAIFGVVGLILMAITFLLALPWSRPLGVEEHLARDTRWLLVLLGTQFAIQIPCSVYGRVLEALGHFPLRNAMKICGVLARNALFVVVLLGGGGLVAIGIVISVCSLIEIAATIVLAHQCVPSLRFSAANVTRGTLRTIWGYSAYIFSGQSANRIAEHVAPIILNVFLGPAAITYFGIASTLNSKGTEVLLQMIRVITPAVSKLEGTGNMGAIRHLLLVGSRYILYLAIPIQLSLICFARPFLFVWMGERYAELAYPTVVILAVPLPLSITAALAGQVLRGIGSVKWHSLVSIARSVATVILSIVMAYCMGIEGVATASSVLTALTCLATAILVCRATGTAFTTLVTRAYLKPALFSLALLPPWIAGQQMLPPRGWGPMILVGSVGLLVYGAVVLLGDRGVRENSLAFLAALCRVRPRREERVVARQ